MVTVALVGASGSPGVTTVARGLAGAFGTGTTLVEASPFGGTLAAVCRLPWSPGITTLAAATRAEVSGNLLEEHLQHTEDGMALLVGAASAVEAWPSLNHLAPRIAPALSRCAGHVVIDTGILWPASPSWVLAVLADVTLVVLGQRGSWADVAARVSHAQHLVRSLADAGAVAAAVVVGEAPYSGSDIATCIGTEVIAVLPGTAGTFGTPGTLDTPGSQRGRRQLGSRGSDRPEIFGHLAGRVLGMAEAPELTMGLGPIVPGAARIAGQTRLHKARQRLRHAKSDQTLSGADELRTMSK